MPRDRYEDSDEEDRRRRRRKEESRKRDRKKDSKHRRDSDRKHKRDSDSESDYRRHRRSHKRRKRRRSDDYDDDDDERRENSDYERRYNYDDKDDDDNDKRRKKKSRKKDDKNRKKTKPKISKPDKSKLYFMGDPRNAPPETKIDAEKDYFSFHNEFWIYLFREEGVCFNDLDTPQAREAFGRFAKDYNAGRLEESYYTRSFPNQVLQESKTTQHSWGFKTTTAELKGLGDLQKGIRRQTEYSEKKKTNSHDVRKMASLPSNEASCAPVESLQRKRPTVQERRRTDERRDTKRWRETVKLTHQELTGGPKDFRERQLEKKRELSSKIHGAHRDREAAGVELSDADVYGDGGLEAAKARLLKSKERRNQKQNNRLQELQQKEEDRKNNMLKMLGLENLKGQKLEIAPRK